LLTGHLFRASRAASHDGLEIIIAVLHGLRTDGMLAYVRLFCPPPTLSSAATGRILNIGQSTNQTTWAVSDVTIVTVTRN